MKQFIKKRGTEICIISGFLFIVAFLFFISQQLKTDEYKEKYYSLKEIKAKETVIENRISAIDFVAGEGSITKSVTVYYFISKEGMSTEVDRKTYFSQEIGDIYYGKWE